MHESMLHVLETEDVKNFGLNFSFLFLFSPRRVVSKNIVLPEIDVQYSLWIFRKPYLQHNVWPSFCWLFSFGSLETYFVALQVLDDDGAFGVFGKIRVNKIPQNAHYNSLLVIAVFVFTRSLCNKKLLILLINYDEILLLWSIKSFQEKIEL